MATRTQKVKLGVFLVSATVLFAATIIVLTGMGLWEERTTYYIKFRESVSGLEQGAPVKLTGVRVGTIEGIRVDPDNVEIVEVRLQVDKGTPVKEDTRAYINMQGITGLKFIELRRGTADAKSLPPGSEIQAGRSMMEQLTGRASDIGLKVEKLLNNALQMTRETNQVRVDEIIANSEKTSRQLATASEELTLTLQSTRSLIDDNRPQIESLLTEVHQTSRKTNDVLDGIARLTATSERTIEGAQIPTAVDELRHTNMLVQQRLESVEFAETIEKSAVALDSLTVLLNNLSQTVSQNQDQLRATLFNFRLAAESFKELARSLRAKPSRLLFDDQPKPRELP